MKKKKYNEKNYILKKKYNKNKYIMKNGTNC